MKNVNVKVVMNAEGQVEVVGLNKDGSVSAVNYTVTQTSGVKEFAKSMMAKGAEKQYAALKAREASEPKASEQPSSTPKQEDRKPVVNKKGYDSIKTNGRMFTNMKGFKYNDVFHAVRFNVEGKGECIVGFAKDRNQFIEHRNGENLEVTRTDVLKRLAKYEGKDAAKLTKMIQGLKPVTMAAGQCSVCGCDVNRSVKEYSLRKYEHIVCRDCQGDFNPPIKKGAQESETPVNQAPSDSEAQHQENIGTSVDASQYEGELVQDELPEFNLGYEDTVDTCECGEEKSIEIDKCVLCIEAQWAKEAEEQLSAQTGEDKEGESEEGETERSEETTDEQKTNVVAEASEERISEAEASSSPKGNNESHDHAHLFDEDELVVNAGVKGMNGSESNPVE